jgi:excisionase family DNA binding protein
MLTLSEAAAQLGISPATLRHQVGLGRMTARLFGKTYVITAEELERYRATSLGRPGRPSHRSVPRCLR